MKITKSKLNTKKTLLVVFLVAAITSTVVFMYIRKTNSELEQNSADNNSSERAATTRPPTEQEVEKEQKNNLSEKEQFIESDEPTSRETPTSNDNISISIEQSTPDTATILTKLVGFNAGRCELSINNGDLRYQDSADVIFQPEYSICAGFSVPISKLGKGSWNVSLTVVNDDGTSVNKQTIQEVK